MPVRFTFSVLAMKLVLGIALFSVVSPVHAESPRPRAAAELSPEAPYRAEQSRRATYRVDFRVAVTAPQGTEKLRVWLPLPTSDNAQKISQRHLKTFPRSVTPSIQQEPLYGNTFAYFEFDDPKGAQLITHRFQATIPQLDWNVDYGAVSQPEHWPSAFDKYRRDDPRIDPSGQLDEVIDQIIQQAPTADPADRLLASMGWIDRNLIYDHAVASLEADPVHGLTHRRGHCSDYHGLCQTLSREAGYPSRVTYGLQMFDKASPSHCKLEVFLPPHGWVSYDLSETQKLVKRLAGDASLTPDQQNYRIEAVRERTRRGFRENTWLRVTRGTHYPLAPAADAGPVPVVRTIYAEADGEPLPDPDPSNPNEERFAWMTIHRVDGDGHAKRFQQLEPSP